MLIDATIVRMVLVPATMELLGDRNWWIPKWLDRILPNIEVEGEHHIAPVPTSELEGEGERREPERARARLTARFCPSGSARSGRSEGRTRDRAGCRHDALTRDPPIP